MSIIIESFDFNRLEKLNDHLLKNSNKFHQIIKCNGEIKEISKKLDDYNEDSPISSVIIHLSVKQLIKNEQLVSNYRKFIEEIRVKRNMKATFIIVLMDYEKEREDKHFSVISSQFFQAKASMVTMSIESIVNALSVISMSMGNSGIFSCPICKEYGIASTLSQDELREHIYMFHSTLSLDEIMEDIPLCPFCDKPMSQGSRIGTHIHENHGPKGEKTEKELSLSTIYPFCLVVVRRKRDNTFLLVNEAAGRGYWLPGGRLNVNESMQTCAKRETKEETGIDIELKGILRVEYSPMMNYSRMRVIFYAEPVDENQLPKSIPDYESVGACYVTVDELKRLNLRGKEPVLWFNYVSNGKPIHPLSLLSLENAMLP
ncbi:hypothetical protein DLAC_10797 [Tieghemostelium lacteum]|uniref:Nudix hydrolase domain-containing protein n=1 Tax=Tieghemostelium lacteum TaxID=361077 RepID=A0A151Z4N8_TIELA|nr:hypothetical protein DLAC_10797 [Tieghemostelium lacteum]|eukprot:KYQ88764.1 hypothetical protein DLAC_10797 [Tieghemostelium lacteum]